MKKLLGKNVPPSRVDKLIKEADTDGDGMIGFEEFLVMFRNENQLMAREELADESSSHTADGES